MKILKLRFQNLNSLYGEWEIDLSAPEYLSDGIFAITGPTGAGKSTIMDAICLALYAATPRLGNISSGNNEIMSRNTGECYSEVIFESPEGRFRCNFNQHRAHKKPDGNLLDPKHEIVDDTNGQVIESKKSRVGKVVAEKTGMDFERFTRSMLLAQGRFAAFLQANASTRAPILEQITGTQIYRDISIAVHERLRIEEEKLQKHCEFLDGVPLMTETEENDLSDKLKSNQHQIQKLGKNLEESEKGISKLVLIENLEQEITDLKKEGEIIQRDMENSAPEAEQLKLALKASEIEAEFSPLEMLENQIQEDKNKLQMQKEQLPDLQKVKDQSETAVKNALSILNEAVKELKTQTIIFKKVRALDGEIAAKKSVYESRKEELEQYQNELNKNIKKITKVQTSLKKAEKEHENILEYQKKNFKDESLISEFSAIKELMDAVLKNLNEIEGLSNRQKSITSNILAAQKKLEAQKKKCGNIETENLEIQKAKADFQNKIEYILKGKEFKDYQHDYENCLRKIAEIKNYTNFEEYRAHLEDQKPCPLCGALEHPFAQGNIPHPDEFEERIAELKKFFDEYESCANGLKKLEEKADKAQHLLFESQKLLTELKHELESSTKDQQVVQKDYERLKKAESECRSALIKKLKLAGIEEFMETEVSELLKTLQTKRELWLENSQKLKESEKTIEKTRIELRGYLELSETRNKELKEKQVRFDQAFKEHEQLLVQRKNLFAEKDPDEEEQRLESVVEKAQKNFDRQQGLFEQARKKCAEAETRLADLSENIKARVPLLEKLEESFAQALMKQGFPDEKSWLMARIPSEKRKELEEMFKKLDRRRAENQSRLEATLAKLENEKTTFVEGVELKELRKQRDELKITLENILEEAGALKQKLEDNLNARKKVAEQYKKIEAQKEELLRWQQLHHLIGSADGNKYRKFAQSITFDLLIMEANKELEKLSDRYLLLQSEETPLELCVVDNYQAGDVRSIRNLSGGESFLVSLALALGLSQMSSRNVRVDSLFLDEGFGTLDDEALDAALETLANLHGEGKLIGIISHVAALKDRIGTRINIEPRQQRGRSTIQGPGCTKIR